MSFIAVTVHCIHMETLETKSFFLCCEYFPGSHTKLAIAQKLYSIFGKYGILDKVNFITSDQAGEYVWGIHDQGNQYKSMNDLRDDVLFEDESDTDEIIEMDVEPHAVIENEFPLPFPNDAGHLDQGFESHDVFGLEPGVSAENNINQDELPLLPKLNRISCSSHILDKVIDCDYHNINTKVKNFKLFFIA